MRNRGLHTEARKAELICHRDSVVVVDVTGIEGAVKPGHPQRALGRIRPHGDLHRAFIADRDIDFVQRHHLTVTHGHAYRVAISEGGAGDMAHIKRRVVFGHGHAPDRHVPELLSGDVAVDQHGVGAPGGAGGIPQG